MNSLRVAVLGTGAQGAGVGADLTRAGFDVTFIEQWPAHVEAMRERGIEVRLPSGTEVTPVRVHHLCEVAELRETFDLVYLVTKAYDTRWACELIRPLLAPDGVVIGLQNGMSVDDIADVVGPERTIGAVIEMASNMFEPGIVTRQNTREASWFAIGSVDSRARGRVEDVRQTLSSAGRVEVSDDILSAKWMKLTANAGELVPSAILGLPLAQAAAIPEVRAFMDLCGAEAAHTALAAGRSLAPVFGLTAAEVPGPEEYAVKLLDIVLSDYSRPDTLTTVLQDWIKGRRAEIEELNGYVAEVGQAHGVPTPANQRTVELARLIESGELQRTPENAALLTV